MLIIGIDIGTTGAKAIVANEKGEILNNGYQSYPIISKAGGIVEQDARLWYDAACKSVRQALAGLDAGAVRALSLSTQGASSLLVDKNFNPLMNAITWMDSRAVKENEQIAGSLGEEYIYRRTGWKPQPYLDAAKFLWINKNMKDVFAKYAYYISTLEYMNYKLTGIVATDPTNCAMRQLMDINTLEYDENILETIGADKSKLPPIMPSGSFLSVLTNEAAQDLGLSRKVKIYNGAHDQYCGLFGANVINEGELTLSTGTSWVTLGVTEEPLYTDSYISPGPHIVKDKYGALASIPVAGAALDWLRGKIIGGDFDEINKEVKQRAGKNEDLFFYPYLSGAAFPLWNDGLKGTFAGLTLAHDKYDMALACMEGVAFHLKLVLDEYESVKTIKIMGGALKSKAWMTIISSLNDCDIYAMNQKDTSCVGAALMAAVGEGLEYNRLANKMSMCEKMPKTNDDFAEHYKNEYIKYVKSLKSMSDIKEQAYV